MSAYTIKPLEWENDMAGNLSASTAVGSFDAFEWFNADGYGWKFYKDRWPDEEGNASSLEEAKAACEALYTSLVLSLLHPAS